MAISLTIMNLLRHYTLPKF